MNKLHRHDKKIAQLRNPPYSEDSSFVSSCMYVHSISRCQVVSRPMCVYECQCVMMLDGQLLKFSIKPAQTQVSLVFVIPISTPFGECSAARVCVGALSCGRRVLRGCDDVSKRRVTGHDGLTRYVRQCSRRRRALCGATQH